jgi:hypothetical protein
MTSIAIKFSLLGAKIFPRLIPITQNGISRLSITALVFKIRESIRGFV